MRAVVVYLSFLLFTPILGAIAILAAMIGIEDRPGGIYDWATKTWTRLLVGAAGA